MDNKKNYDDGILYFNLQNSSILNFDENFNRFLVGTPEVLKKFKKTEINLINTYDIFHRRIFKECKFDINTDQIKKIDSFFYDFADQYLRWSFNHKLSLEELRKIYHEFAEYWMFFFDNFKIKKIYFDNVPHRAFDYVAYRIAKLTNIETVIFETTNLNYRVFAKPNLLSDLSNLKKIRSNKKINNMVVSTDHVKELKKNNIINTLKDELLLFIKLILKVITFQKGDNYLIPYTKNNFFRNLKYLFFIYLSKLKKFFYTVYYNLSCIKLAKIQINEDDMIFYKHYQPEATSNPSSLPLINQNQCLELLLKTKKNIFLKEHPTALTFNNRHMNKSSNKLSNITFYKKNKIKLINNKFLNKHICVTLSGTVGLECALLGYKVICFGKPWYYFLPNVHVYYNLKNLNSFLLDRQKFNINEIKIELLNFINDYTEEFNIDNLEINEKIISYLKNYTS